MWLLLGNVVSHMGYHPSRECRLERMPCNTTGTHELQHGWCDAILLREHNRHVIIILWFRQTHRRHAIINDHWSWSLSGRMQLWFIILWVLHAYRHAITMRRRQTHARSFNTARTPDNMTDAMLFYGKTHHAIIIFLVRQTHRHAIIILAVC